MKFDFAPFVPMPKAILCEVEGCDCIAKTRPVVVGGPSGSRPGAYPPQLCYKHGNMSGEVCLNDAADCNCGRNKEAVNMPLCRECYMAMPCANAEKKGCTGKRWRSGSVLCSTCALALPCKGKNCDHTRSRESEPLCFDCQGRKKCSRCNLVYTEGSGTLYCEECKPLCKVKGMKCNGMAYSGKRYCGDCKPPKKTSSKKGGRCMKKGLPL